MFSPTVFKQTFKSNIKLWLVFTTILAALSCLIIAIFNPSTMDQILGLMERLVDDPNIMARIAANFSLLNMLSMQFYGGMGILLPLIYMIITANALICSQVDRGSMAYTLSTPIKRTAVVITQAVYLVVALAFMFGILTFSGLVTAELTQGGVFFRAFTEDVQAVATHTGHTNAEVADDLTIILNSPENMQIGADARGIEIEVYTMYLQILMAQQQTDALGDDAPPPPAPSPEEAQINEQMQNNFQRGLEKAAELLDTDIASVFTNLRQVKNDPAVLAAAAEEAGMHPMQFVGIINMQLANEEILHDHRFEFDVFYYLMINLGIFLLMFATSAISFLFSCIFNLTKNSLALGAGIPIAFYIFQTMAMVGDDMEFFRYLTINTLYNPTGIVQGEDYIWRFAVLAAIGLVLYCLSVKIFKEKDLPL